MLCFVLQLCRGHRGSGSSRIGRLNRSLFFVPSHNNNLGCNPSPKRSLSSSLKPAAFLHTNKFAASSVQRQSSDVLSSKTSSSFRHSSHPTALSAASSTDREGTSDSNNKPSPMRRAADDYDSLLFVPATPKKSTSGGSRLTPPSSMYDEEDDESYSYEENSHSGSEGEREDATVDVSSSADAAPATPRAQSYNENTRSTQRYDNTSSYNQQIPNQKQTTQRREQTNSEQIASPAILSTRALYQFRPLPPNSSRQMPPTLSYYDSDGYDNIDPNDNDGNGVIGEDDDFDGSNFNAYSMADDPYNNAGGGEEEVARNSRVTSNNKIYPSKQRKPIESKSTSNYNQGAVYSLSDFTKDTPQSSPSSSSSSSSDKVSTPKPAIASGTTTTDNPRSLRPRVTPSFLEPVKTKAMSSNDKNWFDGDDGDSEDKSATSKNDSNTRNDSNNRNDSNDSEGKHDNNDNKKPSQRKKLPTEASSGNSSTSHLTALTRQLEHLTCQIYQLNDGVEFNINSPKQVANVLFGEDGTGDCSTNKDVLEAMASAGNEMAGCIYKYRKLSREIKREQRRIEQQEKGDRKNDYYGNLARKNARSMRERAVQSATGGGSGENQTSNTGEDAQIFEIVEPASETSTDDATADINVQRREPLLLIDTSAYIFRAYHALPPLHRSDGTPTGALHGVCRMLQNLLLTRLLKGERPRVVLAFDSVGPNFRHDLYPEYKANRGPCPDDLVPQFALVREAAEALGVVQVQAEGYEADDVIATLARTAVEEGVDVDILSGDKDLMQLITPPGIEPSVHMIDPMHFDRVDHDDVIKKWGVSSEKLGDVLALAGDASDNIPGAPGIGPKIAATLINDYGTLSNLISQIDGIKQKKRRESLVENAEKVLFYRELVTLDDSIPMSKMTLPDSFQGLNSLRMSSFDPNRLIDFYKSMELNACQNQLQNRLQSGWVQSFKPPPSPKEYEDVPF